MAPRDGCHNSLHTCSFGSSMALTIDHREISIRQVYDGEFSVEALPLGDFMIEYADEPDKTWLAERKTARDLGESIKSGRWADQLARLFGSGHRIVVIIEGDLNRDGSLPLKNLMGAIINASMLGRLTVHRTWDYHETACLLKALLVKMANWGGGPPTTSGLSYLSGKEREMSDAARFACYVAFPTCPKLLLSPCWIISATSAISNRL